MKERREGGEGGKSARSAEVRKKKCTFLKGRNWTGENADAGKRKTGKERGADKGEESMSKVVQVGERSKGRGWGGNEIEKWVIETL